MPCVFAYLRHRVRVAFDAALHVGSVFERRAKLFFLLHAMRTPIRAIHLHAAIAETAREPIVFVLHAVAEIVSQPERGHDQHRIDRNAPPISARSVDPESFFLPFSALLRHGFFISRVETGRLPGPGSDETSNHHPKRRRQHVDRLAVQRQHLAIHHHIHRPVELKFNAPNRPAFRQRMPRVRAIIKRRQIPDQPQSPNRPPPHILDQSVIGNRIGRNHHGAARELAVVKCQKQAGPRIKFLLTVGPHRKRPPIKPCQTKKNGQQISELTQPLKPPMPQRRHVRRETQAQKIRVVNRSVFMRQPQDITRPRTPRLQTPAARAPSRSCWTSHRRNPAEKNCPCPEEEIRG